jgi:hypothetical protein
MKYFNIYERTIAYLHHAPPTETKYNRGMAKMVKTAHEATDRAQTETEVASVRESLFADLKEAAQKGREDRGSASPR